MGVNLLTKTIATAYSQATDWLYMVVGGADRRIIPEDFFKARDGNGTVLYYGTLSAAVSAIGATQATLLIPTTTSVTASLTIPSNITLEFSGTGMISVSAGQTLTINGPLVAPLRQIFTGSGSVRFGSHVEVSYANWFASSFDGSADITSAVQKALDVWNDTATTFRGAVTRVVGAGLITSTLSITNGGVILESTGWGVSTDTRKRGYLKWNGAAGSPMVLVQDCVQSGVKNIRLIGKSTAKPTAAVEFKQTGGGSTMDHPVLENVWIGSYYSGDSDNAVQFDAGVKFSGLVNCDTGQCKSVHIQQATIGVDNQNPNATVFHWDTLQIGFCTTGYKSVSPHHIVTNMLCAGNDVDIELAAQGAELTIYGFVSEGSGRMAVGSAVSPMRLLVIGGSFQAIDAANGGNFEDEDVTGKRWLMDFHGNAANAGLHIELRDFNLTFAGSPPTPVILAWNTADFVTSSGGTSVTLILDNVKGFTSANFNLGSDNFAASARVVVFNRMFGNSGVASQFNRYIHDPTDAEDRGYEDLRFDMAGKQTVYGGPLKVKRLRTPDISVAATGGSGTSYGYRVSALTRDGETLACSTVTVSGGATLSPTVYNTISINPVLGAYAYKIYGRTSGSEQLLKTFTVAEWADTFQGAWRDDGSLTPSGALPSVNRTGNALIYGAHKVMNADDGAGNAEYIESVYEGSIAKIRSAATGTGTVRALKIGGPDVAIQIGDTDAWGVYIDKMLYPAANNSYDLGADSFRVRTGHFGTSIKLGAASLLFGTGTPEGAVTANVGSLYLRTDGGAGTTLYVKESGSGNTGWAAK